MALAATIVISYLISSRTERATSSLYSARLRAKMTAEAGLASAIQVLHDNTRYGNYVTAMPAPLPTPVPIYTEVYRPTDPATHGILAGDYLTTTNAGGELLVSRAATTAGTPAGPDPRPTPVLVPNPVTAGGIFALPSPNPTLTPEVFPASGSGAPTGNSYNFNQVVRVGTNNNARLIQPSPTPAPPPVLGQWVRMRNANGELVGRYAFYVEDESMKVNLNQSGNSAAVMRPDDSGTATITSTQVQELDPAAVLPTSASRNSADSALTAAGATGSRFGSKGSAAVLGNTDWTTNIADVTPMTTVTSRDDLTTAKGWKRLDLNTLVGAAGDNTAKITLAKRLSDWIRDAWTGPVTLANLQSFQIFNDERLRLQLAANIIDYIDPDGIPTDLGNYENGALNPIPDPTSDPQNNTGYPIIGIERGPYLVEVDVVYTATNVSPAVPGQANIAMSFRFNFFNLFDRDLTLGNYIRTIRIKGIPVIVKNSATVLDHESQVYTITVGGSSSSANSGTIPDGVVPWGGDYVANGTQGAKTFRSNNIFTEQVSYSNDSSLTQFEAGMLYVDMYDANNKRIDSVRIALNDRQAKYSNGSVTPNDFLQAKQAAASINATYTLVASGTNVDFGDPRYRPGTQTQRIVNLTRTDTTRFTSGTQSGDDKAEQDCRAYSVDWYDYLGDRPLVFHRDGPMLSIGELGNVSACEFPWRTVYLQYAGRTQNTTDATIGPMVQDRRGSSSAAASNPGLLPQDYVLLDLFKTTPATIRDGSVNLNSQFYVANNNLVTQGAPLSLFLNSPVGGPSPIPAVAPTPPPPIYMNASQASIIASLVAGRRSAMIPAASSPWIAPATASSLPNDNKYKAPYFTIGEAAADVSRAVNSSTNSTTNGNSPSRAHSTCHLQCFKKSADTGDHLHPESRDRCSSGSALQKG